MPFRRCHATGRRQISAPPAAGETGSRPPRPSTRIRSRAAAAGCALALAARAAEARAAKPYVIDSWASEAGLPQSSVNGILQTRDGFVWLTTFGGLVRYDGLRFRTFNPGNTPGLRSSRFLRLFEDRDSNLWVTTEGAGLVRYRAGQFTTYSTRDGLPDDYVVEVAYDDAGNLLAETRRAEARWQGGRFVPHAAPESDPYSRPMHRTRSGAVWHYVSSFGLHRHDGAHRTAVPTGLHVGMMYEDRQGRLWLSTQEGRLVVLAAGRFTDFAVPGVARVTVLKFYEDRRGTLWIGLSNHGLLRVVDGLRPSLYTTADGLAGNDVDALYEDHEGNLWVGTSRGLSRMSPRVLSTYSAADGLEKDNVYTLLEARHGGLWIGGGGGLALYRGGVFKRFDGPHGIGDKLVLSLMEDRMGGLWVGTWAGDAKRLKDGVVTSDLAPLGGPSHAVRALLEDRSGNVWMGGEGGLARFRDGALTRFTKEGGLSGSTVYVLLEDRRGQLWAGTDGGITRIGGGKLTSYTERDGLSGGIVRALHEDAEGTLWIGTYDAGISRLRDGRITRYTTADGLFDDGAFQILEDARGFFWVSSNRGIYRVARRDLDELAAGRIRRVVPTSYGRRDGMLDVECNGGGQPAGCRTHDGRLWFPTQKGVVRIDPLAVPAGVLPPVEIEEVIVDHRQVRFRGGVEIRPGQEGFEAHYTGIAFFKPEQVRFRYRLEGFDSDWIDADTRRAAYYSHLPPGRFRFRVAAASADGVWTTGGAGFTVVVVPPFWRTWWFAALVAAALGSAAVAVYRRRIGRLEQAFAARQELSRRLIAAQEADRRRIAAELHDSLGQELVVIRNWALLALGAAGDGASRAVLLREISERAALALDEVREIAYALGPYQLDRCGLRRTLEEMVERVVAPSGITFRIDLEGLDGALPKESEVNLYRALQEAVTNAVKHSGASTVSLEAVAGVNQLHVSLEDDGRGFDPGEEVQRAGRGLGLTGMAERVRLLGGTLAVRSALGRGAAIDIHIPLDRSSGRA